MRALLDTGCSRTIIAYSAVGDTKLTDVNVPVRMMNGDIATCYQVCHVTFNVNGISLNLECLVSKLVMGYDVLLGMDALGRLAGVYIDSAGRMEFCVEKACVAKVHCSANETTLNIFDDDFSACFNNGKWTVKWKWSGNEP